MLLALALSHALALTAGFAPPAAQRGESPESAYRRFVQGFESAAAIETEFKLHGAGVPGQLLGECKLARPMSGYVRFRQGGAEQRMVANGAAFYYLDDEQRTFNRALNGFADTPILNGLSPFAAWLSEEPLEAERIRRLPSRDQATEVLQIEFFSHQETLWIRNGGQLLAARVVPKHGPSKGRERSFQFQRAAALRRADPDRYEVQVPGGYREIMLDRSVESRLLGIGQRAPDATVTTLVGDDIRLSELKGRLVLLNFWFYD